MTLDEVPEGSLKLVALSEPSAAGDALRAVSRDEDVRQIGDSAWVVFTAAEPAALRDAVRAAVPEAVTVIVVEFERWSVGGDAIDPSWLLRRGH